MAHPLTGKWRITEMDFWDVEDFELCGPAFLEIFEDGTGNLSFIAVTGALEFAFSEAGADFSFDGDDEGNDTAGSGWLELQEDGTVHGFLEFEDGGDSSDFKVRRWTDMDEREARRAARR
jgi:hypothetical protein